MAETADATADAAADPNNICWWYPNDPSCQDQSGQQLIWAEPERYTSTEILVAQISYIMVALLEAISAFLIAFRYRKQDWLGSASDSYYKQYETHVGGTNWWSLANALNTYTKLVVYGAGFITQLLALFGIAPGINQTVWQWGVIVGVTTVNVLFVLFSGMGYDTAVDKARQEEVAGALTVVGQMDEDFALFFGLTSFSGSILWLNYPQWLQGQNDATKEAEESSSAEGEAEEEEEEATEETAEGE